MSRGLLDFRRIPVEVSACLSHQRLHSFWDLSLNAADHDGGGGGGGGGGDTLYASILRIAKCEAM
jgi:hypothetical protein